MTTTCLDFVHAFREPATRDLMAASLIEDLSYYGSVLHAFVVMPHHAHFIAAVPDGGHPPRMALVTNPCPIR